MTPRLVSLNVAEMGFDAQSPWRTTFTARLLLNVAALYASIIIPNGFITFLYLYAPQLLADSPQRCKPLQRLNYGVCLRYGTSIALRGQLRASLSRGCFREPTQYYNDEILLSPDVYKCAPSTLR